MIAYETPSTAAFHSRRQFHAAQKTQNEPISDWFKRLQWLNNKCDFRSVTDYMLIDKFVSGLGDDDFNKISKVATWTAEELILVVIGNPHIFKSTASKEDEHSDDIKHTLKSQVECVKVFTYSHSKFLMKIEKPLNLNHSKYFEGIQ